MKKFILSIIIYSISLVGLAKPRVFFNYHIYYTVDHEPYVETALQFASGSLKFMANENGNLEANLEITQVFMQNEKIIAVDKYVLKSPEMKDSIVDDFFDMQRFKLSTGKYTFDLSVKDLNSGEIIEGKFDIEIEKQLKLRVECADVAFIQDITKSDVNDKFTKNGYRMIPYFTNFFPPDYDKIVYYLELYNSIENFDSTMQYVATFNIRKKGTTNNLESYFQYKKLKSAPIIPIINVLPIHDLKTGEYELVMQVFNSKQDTLLEKITPFKRRSIIEIKPIDITNVDIENNFEKELSSDSVFYFVASLMPISPQYEYERIRKMLTARDTTYLKRYFYSYWVQSAPENPFRGWQDYKIQVQYAEKLFGTQIRKGFETDRGRIHLKYGPPNFITDQANGTSAYPYQIWQYYKIGQRSNMQFIFYNPDLVTNDYPLLHSDMPGEIQNTNWRQELLKRNTKSGESMDGNSGIYFDN
ncbi:hypothetical protein DNU06_14840 [Putridiphycobacter roseus]|uniref:GWxTD domain-containing protein n=1 Tax=Putridiphycobacter roseus TaxID=2219161 RepID=A0A2W1NAL9_9FLAO|nr:GWxTD domain-containing protein [Putridiphycobacter roseus]PZE16073.1 hypothetical protein DNU06_14840 [Putridiphycobacter roseus]